MAHVRTQIREEVVSLLLGLPTTGPNVFDSRPPESGFDDAELPGLNVLTPADTINAKIPNTSEKETRQVDLIVQCKAKGNGAAAIVDQASAEVQAALAQNEKLGGRAKELFLESTSTTISGEIDQPTATAEMIFAVSYRINPQDPETAIA